MGGKRSYSPWKREIFDIFPLQSFSLSIKPFKIKGILDSRESGMQFTYTIYTQVNYYLNGTVDDWTSQHKNAIIQ